jgi:hypothetical protein
LRRLTDELASAVEGERPAKIKDWQPLYMAFPMKGYTKKGRIEAIEQSKSIMRRFTKA